jgi:Arc/MetJ-type ribon-helix-helix transcriptional regulator
MTTKQTAFRLPEDSLEDIDFIISNRFARNATEAVIRALRYFVEEHQPSIDEDVARKVVKEYLTSAEGKQLIQEIFDNNKSHASSKKGKGRSPAVETKEYVYLE